MHRQTPPLSPECQREIAAELKQPAADTPERRKTLARARAAAPFVERAITEAIRTKR